RPGQVLAVQPAWERHRQLGAVLLGGEWGARFIDLPAVSDVRWLLSLQREAEHGGVLHAVTPAGREPRRQARIVQAATADRETAKAADVSVLPAFWPAVHDTDRVAVVVWGSWAIEWLRGNTVIMRPHILGALPNLRV